MSCDNWERGTVKIPSAQWSVLRKTIIAYFNEHQDRLHRDATRLYETVTAAAKGKRGQKRLEAMHEASGNFVRLLPYDDQYPVRVAVWSGDQVRRPKKMDFPHKPISKGCVLSLGPLYIDLDDKTRTVHWSVEEGNRNVEEARDSWLGKYVLRQLGRIEWTRGSGGHFVGNDEINLHEATEAGDGANYITLSFGPLGKKARGY
jgi:hypothetical protein